MRILVTGCAGFIGSHLCESLLEDGHSVLGVDCFTDNYSKSIKVANLARSKRTKGFKLVNADLASSPLSPLFDRVEAVFHLAAMPGVRQSWGATFSQYMRNNILATQRLLEAAKKKRLKRLVYASSSSIYGDSERMPTPEDAVPNPVSPYGATKLMGEHLCRVYFRNFGVPLVTLRFFTVFGPRQRPDMAFSRFISRISKGEDIQVFGSGRQRRDFTFVRDVVTAGVLALSAKPGMVYNVGAGRTASLNEVVSLMERLMGKRANVVRRQDAPGDVRNTSADITRIAKDLSYGAKTSLEDGLREQIHYQMAMGP